MTTNQINFYNAKETKRHNKAMEKETARHNMVGEKETHRHAVTSESLQFSDQNIQKWWYDSQAQHLVRQDAINYQHYSNMDAESIRSHQAQEAENKRHNVATEIEVARHNEADESNAFKRIQVDSLLNNERIRNEREQIEINRTDAQTRQDAVQLDVQNSWGVTPQGEAEINRLNAQTADANTHAILNATNVASTKVKDTSTIIGSFLNITNSIVNSIGVGSKAASSIISMGG